MLDMSKYLLLFLPAVEWIMQCLAHKASEVHTAYTDKHQIDFFIECSRRCANTSQRENV